MDAANYGLPLHQPSIAKLGPSVLARFSVAAQDWVGSGATWVDLPWTVPAEFTLATRPLFAFGHDVSTPHGMLLASGEQAFLWMDERERFPHQCMIGWTPCFRDEPVLDRWHQYGFIKLEAYRPLAATEHPQQVLMALVDLAQRHFERWAGTHARQRWFPDGTCDIEINGHEVGSYGVRNHPTIAGRRYVFGTVLAEPRFSEAASFSIAKI